MKTIPSKIFNNVLTNSQVNHPSQEQLDQYNFDESILISIAQTINLVTYKKNFDWTWYPCSEDEIFCYVVGSFPDAIQVGQEVSTPYGLRVKISDGFEQRIFDGLYEAFKALEMHELDEFFMVGDTRPHDPHKNAVIIPIID